MARTLVVYFSRTGTTAQVANRLADLLQADVERIVEPRSRLGPMGYLRSLVEATVQRAPRIAETIRDPADYDLVILGTPVWGASASSPMRAYIRGNRDKLRRVAFFCTMGARGGERALDQLDVLCGKAPVAALALHEHDVKRGRVGTLVDEFARRLQQSNSPPKRANNSTNVFGVRESSV